MGARLNGLVTRLYRRRRHSFFELRVRRAIPATLVFLLLGSIATDTRRFLWLVPPYLLILGYALVRRPDLPQTAEDEELAAFLEPLPLRPLDRVVLVASEVAVAAVAVHLRAWILVAIAGSAIVTLVKPRAPAPAIDHDLPPARPR